MALKLSKLSECHLTSIDSVLIKQVPLLNHVGFLSTITCHINKLCKKIASGIGAIKRIKPFVSPEILHYIYSALVKPHFDYCRIV